MSFRCRRGDWRLRMMAPLAVLLVLLVAAPVAKPAGVEDSLYLPALGARALGMGGTSVATKGELSCAAANPALLAFITPWHAAADYRHLSSRVQGLSIQGSGYSTRHQLAYGLAIESIRADRRVWPHTASSLRNWTVQAKLSAAHTLSNQLALGAALKPARWQLYGENDNTVEMDLGVAYPVQWNEIDILFGAVARDLLAAKVSRHGVDTALDASVLLGVTGRYFSGDSLWAMTVAADLEAVKRDYVGDPQDRFRFGGELTYYRWDEFHPAVRMGYDGEHMSVGIGFDYRFVSVDWAKTSWSKWGYGQAVSVTIDPRGFWDWFEQTTGSFKPLVNWRDSLPVYRHEQFESYQRAAQEQVDAQRYDSALALYRTARVFADNGQRVATADSAMALLRSALDRLAREADSLMVAGLQDSLLRREEAYTESKHRQLLMQADSCLMRRDYQSAEDLVSLVLSEDSTNAEAMDIQGRIDKARELEIAFGLVLADSAEKEEKLGDALEAYSRILQLDSTQADGVRGRKRIEDKLEARRLVGRALRDYEQSDMSGALSVIDSAVARDSSLQRVRDFLVITYNTQADTVSLDELKNDTTVYIYYLQGLQHRSNHEYRQAMEAFSKVLKVYPNCPEVQKVYDEALELHNKSERDTVDTSP